MNLIYATTGGRMGTNLLYRILRDPHMYCMLHSLNPLKLNRLCLITVQEAIPHACFRVSRCQLVPPLLFLLKSLILNCSPSLPYSSLANKSARTSVSYRCSTSGLYFLQFSLIADSMAASRPRRDGNGKKGKYNLT